MQSSDSALFFACNRAIGQLTGSSSTAYATQPSGKPRSVAKWRLSKMYSSRVTVV